MKQFSIWELTILVCSDWYRTPLCSFGGSCTWLDVRTGKRVREVHAMPVNIGTKDKVGSRANNVYGARVQRGDANDSVRKDNAETFVCGTCAEMIGRVEINGECGATLVVCPAAILRQWQDEISKYFSTPYQCLWLHNSFVIFVVFDFDIFVH